MVYIKGQLYKCIVFNIIFTYILITLIEDTLKYYIYISNTLNTIQFYSNTSQVADSIFSW
jgi:hypothetical protein